MNENQKVWKPSPTVLAAVTALVLILGLAAAERFRSHHHRVNANVEITPPIYSIDRERLPNASTLQPIPEGEVARLALRVREAAAMLMGVAALYVDERLRRPPPQSLDSLLKHMAEQKLLPPNIVFVRGVLGSSLAVLNLRYREQPFGLEVASIGRNPLDGPPILVRLDAREDDSLGVVLLIAKKRESAALPEPFSPLTETIRMHWSIEPLRERYFTNSEIDHLNQWAREHAAIRP
jgi:hypothetical protein